VGRVGRGPNRVPLTSAKRLASDQSGTLASMSPYVALALGILVALTLPLIAASRAVAVSLANRNKDASEELGTERRARLEAFATLSD
jgi:hypothetical protein